MTAPLLGRTACLQTSQRTRGQRRLYASINTAFTGYLHEDGPLQIKVIKVNETQTDPLLLVGVST